MMLCFSVITLTLLGCLFFWLWGWDFGRSQKEGDWEAGYLQGQIDHEKFVSDAFDEVMAENMDRFKRKPRIFQEPAQDEPA